VTREFARFILAGGIAAAANVASRALFSLFVALPVAVVLAYLVGMAVAFALMRRAVFPPGEGRLARQVAIFALVNVAAVLQTLVVTLVLARWVLPAMGMREHVELAAHLVGVAVPIVTSYLGHKHFTFR
jgi:putative flippase GtrA